MTLFSYVRIKADGRDAGALVDQVATAVRSSADAVTLWGTFRGLFGLGSNEAIVMLAGSQEALGAAGEQLSRLPDAQVLDSQMLEPTVRPTDSTPLDRDGLVVFRFFDVAHRDADEIARLSNAAWTTFASADDYESEPLALFREHAPVSDHGRMLLMTWYDGFASWETSRTPAPEATENFRRRRELTTGTLAYATRLIRPS